MLSKELKDFIEITLEDGVITDKERSLLYDKAAKEGISINEMDVIIDAELAKHIKNQASSSPMAKYRELFSEKNKG